MKIIAWMKHFVNQVLLKKGHIITHYSTIPSFVRLIKLLHNAKIQPKIVFDIGVAEGTPWLYNRFPHAKYVLIDPTKESLPHMEQWKNKLNADIYNIALGDRNCDLEIIIRSDSDIGSASLYPECGPHLVKERYTVNCKRFDDLFGEVQSPALCKIDVQGAELSVLRGMGEKIHAFDIFIVETSLLATLQGDAPEFGEIVNFMSSEGFVMYDIVGMTRRPLDQALAQVDAVFVPTGSPLRRDRRWKAEI